MNLEFLVVMINVLFIDLLWVIFIVYLLFLNLFSDCKMYWLEFKYILLYFVNKNKIVNFK